MTAATVITAVASTVLALATCGFAEQHHVPVNNCIESLCLNESLRIRHFKT